MTEDLQPGPCVICSVTNYPLSMGGPTICPACDCGDFGIERIKGLGKAFEYAREEIERLQLENTRLAMQVLKAQELMKALTAALNLNDQLMTEIMRLSKESSSPIPVRLLASKLSFDDQMKKLFGPPRGKTEQV